VSLCLHICNMLFLILRQHLCHRSGDAHASSDGVSRALIVPCQHHNLDTHAAECRNRFTAGGFLHISCRYYAEQLSASGLCKEQRCLPLLSQIIDPYPISLYPRLLHQRQVAGQVFFTVDSSPDASSGNSLECFKSRRGHAFV